jgi:phospholipase/carboxylesterase
MHRKEFITSGQSLEDSSRVLIMIHGRGSSAEDILSIAEHLNTTDFYILAQQQSMIHIPSWLLHRPMNMRLSSALSLLKEIVTDLETKALPKPLFFLGFSQGACLTLEFVARDVKYGGVIAFTGGLIGVNLSENYSGNFPVLRYLLASDDHMCHEK